MDRRRRAPAYDQAVVRPFGERSDGPFDLAGVVQIDRVQLHTKRRRQSLHGAELAGLGRYGGIAKDRHARHARHDLLSSSSHFPLTAYS